MSARYDSTNLRHFCTQGVEKGATHMYVVYQLTGVTNCRNDYNDRHYYVMPGEEAQTVICAKLDAVFGYKKLLEVYDLRKPLEPQLTEYRAFHID